MNCDSRSMKANSPNYREKNIEMYNENLNSLCFNTYHYQGNVERPTESHRDSDHGDADPEDADQLILRKPRLDDGAMISELVQSCKPLDTNSTYCYLLLSRDFAETCVVAEDRGEIVAFLSGYRPPDRRDVFFLWQIAVDVRYRKKGIAKRMLHEVLNRPSMRECRFIETTISPSNERSMRLFTSLSRELEAHCDVVVCFSESHFGHLDHEEENLFRIGPFKLNE